MTDSEPPAKPGDTLASPPPRADLDELSRTTVKHDRPSIAEASRYHRVSLLGEGGMGEVHLCADRLIGREVAMKRIKADAAASHASYARFVREAMVQARLEHPAIVPVYDVSLRSEARAWFTMKRLRGRTLDEIVRALRDGDPETTAAYSRRKLLTAMAQVCLAVDYAHSRGVVHRDLKPANVMLGEFGEVHVLDWGLAKVVEGDAGTAAERMDDLAPHDEDVTEIGALMGTPGYMSPEQARGATDKLDARSDVYALGAILYEVIAKEPLHRGAHRIALLNETIAGVDARPSARGHDAPPELEAVCVRATARDPEDRFPSARALANAIERFLDGDRDVELRRSLARQHLASAREGLAKGDRERPAALRELGRSVALDPSDPDALALLGATLAAAPATIPDGAREDLERARQDGRRAAARQAAMRYVLWAAFLPLAFWMGIREWPTTLAIVAFIVLSGLDAFRTSRKESIQPRHGLRLLLTSSVAIALMSALFGPFVLVPGIVATNAMYFVMNAEPRHRALIVGVSALVIVLPFAADALGLVPPAYSFGEAGFVIRERASHFPALQTTTALLLLTISTILIPAAMVARMRDALASAEERLFVQAWHLRQMLPAVAARE